MFSTAGLMFIFSGSLNGVRGRREAVAGGREDSEFPWPALGEGGW